MRKAILYIGGFNLPDKNAAAQRVISNAKLFRQAGYEVVLIGLSSDITTVGKIFEFDGFSCLNLKYPRTIIQWYYYLFTIKWYKSFIKKLQPEVVIAYNHPGMALRALLNFNGQRGILTISDCTEWYEPDGNFLFKSIKGWDINQRMRYVHPKLDGIVVISNFLDNYYKEKGCKTLLLPPLVDLKEQKWNVQVTRNDDSIRLVYAGSTGRNKDRLDMIIMALEKICSNSNINLHFNVIGMSQEQYYNTYSRTIGTKVPSFVKFLGRLSHIEVIKLLRGSDFQIFIRENNLANTAGFPTKFAESISSGILVLTNHSSDLKEYLHDGINGYSLNISSLEELVDSLKRPLLLSFNEIQNKKENIDRRTFDYHNFIDVTKSFFDSIK